MRIAILALALGACAASEPFNPTPENSWAFPVDNPDPAAASPIDLRHLNEEVAGQHGWIRLTDDGNGFVRGDGEPIRFWGTHMANGVRYGKQGRASRDEWSMDDYHRHARWLARLGVNSVRLGNVAIHDPDPEAPAERLDPVMVEGIFRRIAAAKQAGIYCQLSPVWFHGIKDLGTKLDIEGYQDGERHLTHLLWFHPEIQRVYKAWLRELYTTVNPHTGLSIAEDPAVFALEIANEDSLWWYPVDRLRGEPRRELQRQFAAWCADRYGSAQAALAAWGHRAEEDTPDEGRLQLLTMWQLTRAGEAEGQIPDQRLDDQTAFLIDTQRAFHEEMLTFLRDELGCRQFISSSNFKSVDLVTTEDALRLGSQPLDLICKNNYFGSGGVSDVAGYRLDAGDIMGLRSAVTHPLELPLRMRQVEGKPFLVTETLWNRMHPYETEGPLVLAAYEAAMGIDGFYWAGPRGITWETEPYRTFWEHKGSHPMTVFCNAQPGGMGMFPGAALLLRRGGLETAPTVVHERRTREEVVSREVPLTAEGGYHDFVHEAEEQDAAGQSARQAHIPPEVFLVGRVAVEYVDDPAESTVLPVDEHISQEQVVSATGELIMDRERGLFLVDAPRAQAVTGFLRAAGPIDLGTVTFDCRNEHATLIAVSLDEQPLAESSEILLQVGLPARPTGWRESTTTFEKDAEERAGLLIEATGAMPWRIQNAELTVTIANSELTGATLLDGNGIPQRELELEAVADGVRLTCPPDSFYLVFHR